ncbi:MAG: HD domain-containing protein [Nitrospiraceae bacterium]|nr:MAG: HD domain-containing protein [Nitrospiraceae bacterium]
MFEIRDPIHGFIQFDEWERDIINHPVFQRLRRIKQLAYTDLVYPGATHTRFEHSLGVMHLATRLYNRLVEKHEDLLKKDLAYNDEELNRDRIIVRLAALLHDVGHPPFSHAAEILMPKNKEGKIYDHEQYGAELINHLMKDVIDHHPVNMRRFRITSQDISDFYLGKSSMGKRSFWKDLVSGQLDADRMDYLLRDSYHIGVHYGKYDLDRIISTVSISKVPEDEIKFTIDYDGIHAAEALILARYFMFTQVYFHKTRRAYDYHVANAIKTIFRSNGHETFPPPDTKENIEQYFQWDDWKISGMLSDMNAGEHGKNIIERNHYRVFYETVEVPDEKALEELDFISEKLKGDIIFTDEADKSWYKFDKDDEIYIRNIYNPEMTSKPLSQYSSVVKGLRTIKQIRLYTRKENQKRVKESVKILIDWRENG